MPAAGSAGGFFVALITRPTPRTAEARLIGSRQTLWSAPVRTNAKRRHGQHHQGRRPRRREGWAAAVGERILPVSDAQSRVGPSSRRWHMPSAAQCGRQPSFGALRLPSSLSARGYSQLVFTSGGFSLTTRQNSVARRTSARRPKAQEEAMSCSCYGASVGLTEDRVGPEDRRPRHVYRVPSRPPPTPCRLEQGPHRRPVCAPLTRVKECPPCILTQSRS